MLGKGKRREWMATEWKWTDEREKEKERYVLSTTVVCVCAAVILKMAMIHLQFRRAVFHLSFPSKSHHFENLLLFLSVSICAQTKHQTHDIISILIQYSTDFRRSEEGLFAIFVEYNLCLTVTKLAFWCDCDLGTRVYDPRLIPGVLCMPKTHFIVSN